MATSGLQRVKYNVKLNVFISRIQHTVCHFMFLVQQHAIQFPSLVPAGFAPGTRFACLLSQFSVHQNTGYVCLSKDLLRHRDLLNF